MEALELKQTNWEPWGGSQPVKESVVRPSLCCTSHETGARITAGIDHEWGDAVLDAEQLRQLRAWIDGRLAEIES